MRDVARIDARRLAADSRAAGGEAYAVVDRGPGYRVGVGARRRPSGDPAFFVEVVVDVFREGEAWNRAAAKARLALAAALEARGYRLTWERDGSVAGEVRLPASALEREREEVRRFLGGDTRSRRLRAKA